MILVDANRLVYSYIKSFAQHELARRRRLSGKFCACLRRGAELRLANGISLFGKFDGEFANNSQTYAGTATLRYTW